MKIAVCQFDTKWNDVPANKAKITALMESCKDRQGLEWIIFPEMTLSGFTMDVQKATMQKEDFNFFANLARQYGTAVSFGGVQDGRNHNYTMDNTGQIISSYAKIHLYAFGKEDQYYKAGDKTHNFTLNGMSVMPAVCFDLRFPYLFWNAAEQTDIYTVIASWPMRRAEHWMTLLRARAVENQCYCIGVNNLGKDPDNIEYSGNSMIFDPLGKPILDAGTQEGVFVSQIDVNKELVTKTRTRFPFLKERKPGAVFC